MQPCPFSTEMLIEPAEVQTPAQGRGWEEEDGLAVSVLKGFQEVGE